MFALVYYSYTSENILDINVTEILDKLINNFYFKRSWVNDLYRR
jgi:hypothetical protein